MNLRKIIKYVTTLLNYLELNLVKNVLGRPEGRKEEVEEDQGGIGRTV
jgi:hypothetical protein